MQSLGSWVGGSCGVGRGGQGCWTECWRITNNARCWASNPGADSENGLERLGRAEAMGLQRGDVHAVTFAQRRLQVAVERCEDIGEVGQAQGAAVAWELGEA